MSNPPIPSDRLNFLVDELKKENDQLNLQLNSKDLKIAELEKNRASSTDYQDKYNQLERSKKEQLIENNKEVERLKLQLKKANDRLSSANVSIAEEKKASDKYKAELAEKSELFEKLLDRANEISAKYNDLIVTSEEESEKLQSLQEELDKTVKEANTHLSQHNDLVAKLKNELDAAKTSIAQLKTELSAVKSNKDLQSRLHKNKYNSMQDELNKQIASVSLN
jgi:chromosome segregation ATPase